MKSKTKTSKKKLQEDNLHFCEDRIELLGTIEDMVKREVNKHMDYVHEGKQLHGINPWELIPRKKQPSRKKKKKMSVLKYIRQFLRALRRFMKRSLFRGNKKM